MAHSKGNWEIFEDSNKQEVWANGYLICKIDSEYLGVKQAEANTKLIAAAPEMLECLNELTNCIQGMTNGRVILTVPIELSHKIGEVIKKATE